MFAANFVVTLLINVYQDGLKITMYLEILKQVFTKTTQLSTIFYIVFYDPETAAKE